MIYVYLMKTSAFSKEEVFANYLNQISSERKEQILHIRGEENKLRSLSAAYLLHVAVCDYLELDKKTTAPFKEHKLSGGKPVLTDYPKVHFNLSHSGDYALCAVGNVPVGADIQKYVKIKERMAERFFNEQENECLNKFMEKEDYEREFFRIWSEKEACLKLTGRGLSGIKEKQPKYLAYHLELPGYAVCVCTEDVQEVWVKEIESIAE